MIACLFWILRQLGHPPWSLTGALLLLFTHVFWFAEFKLGQSNLLILSLLMQAWNKPSFRSGLGLGFALLLKPNLFPLALFFFRKPRRSAFPGALALTAILALAFWALFPERSLLAEHREWALALMQSSAKHLFQTGNYSLVTALCVFFPILVSISWVFPILSTLVIAGLAEREARTPRDLGLWSLALLCTVFFSPMAWTQNYVFTLPALACALSSLRERGLSLSKRLRSPLFIVVAVFVCVSQLMQYDTVGKSAYEALIRARYHLWASLLLCLGLFHARRRFGLSDRGRPITFH